MIIAGELGLVLQKKTWYVPLVAKCIHLEVSLYSEVSGTRALQSQPTCRYSRVVKVAGSSFIS